MPGKIIDIATRATDYRLNQLGIRVSKGVCQLISRIGDRWTPIGPRWQLPVSVPETKEDLAYAHALSVTAYQFCREHPESDLLDVLTHGQAPERQGPVRNNLSHFDLLARISAPVSWTSLLAGCEGDPIAASRALIRSSRELLDRRTKETV